MANPFPFVAGSSFDGCFAELNGIGEVRAQAVQMARARIDDTGAQVYWGTTFGGTSTVILFADLASGTYTAFANISATVPMTWASTDAFQFAFVYEVA
jgi:hypothetical protein